jgi:hypothetical protein
VLDTATKRLLDVILIAWSAIWILVGVAVYNEVRGLSALADTVTVAGRSLDDTADTLDAYGSVPFVGGDLREVARGARRTARSARVSAREGRASVDDLARLLGIAVPAVAIGPLALAYALLRVRRR